MKNRFHNSTIKSPYQYVWLRAARELQPEPLCGQGRWSVPDRVIAQSTQVHLVPTCYVGMQCWTRCVPYTLPMIRGAARLEGIPTRRVGTRSWRCFAGICVLRRAQSMGVPSGSYYWHGVL